MPNNTVSIYTPRCLMEVVRQTPPVHTFFRDTFFTNVRQFDTKEVDIDLVKGTRKMAPFVHPRVGGQEMPTAGYETKSYTAPLVNPYMVTTADQLMDRLPGEDPYSGRTPAQRGAEKIMEEYRQLEDAATRREEWMCATALIYGKIPIVGKGVNDIIDFLHSNRETLAAAKQWGKAGVDILADLERWEEAVRLEGFANVDGVIMGKKALQIFLDDEKVQKKLDNRRIEMGLIHPKDLPNGAKYIGHINQPNLDIYTYSEVYLDDWTNPEHPEVKPLVPDNAVLLASWSADYDMCYGSNTYKDAASGVWVTASGPRVLRSYFEHHPDRDMLELMARPLPVPNKVDSWFVGFVC